jgi:hypothetical protein
MQFYVGIILSVQNQNNIMFIQYAFILSFPCDVLVDVSLY